MSDEKEGPLMRELLTTALELVGIACMVVAVSMLTSPAGGLLVAGMALVALGVMAS